MKSLMVVMDNIMNSSEEVVDNNIRDVPSKTDGKRSLQ